MRVETSENWGKLSYEENPNKWEAITNFLKENKHIVEEFQKRYIDSLIYGLINPKEKIRSLILGSLNTSIGRLNDKAETSKIMYRKLDGLKLENNKITFNDFLSKFDVNKEDENSINKLWSKLDDLPGVGPKKAAIFLRNSIYILKEDIFNGIEEEELKKLPIPIDTVIFFILEEAFWKNSGRPEFLSGKPDKDIKSLNKFFSQLVNKVSDKDVIPLLYEDLWFWGHFNKIDKNKTSTLEYNDDKVNAEIMITQDFFHRYDIKNKCEEFHNIIKS